MNLINEGVNKLKLSVCVITYNQEKYIRQSLQSLIDQDVDFTFEIIVADDNSSDGTKAIVEEFINRYPGIIRAMFQEKNTGGSKNNLDVHAAAKGEYIAHMDGDDYALPCKLKKQVEFLDQHPECNIVWHRMKVLDCQTGKIADDLIDIDQCPHEGFDRGDILRFITIGMNSSKMYRSSAKKFEHPGFPVLDFFMNVEQIGEGSAMFAGEEPLGVYRAGIGLASAGNQSQVFLMKSFIYFLRKYPKYKKDISGAALLLFLAAIKNRKWANSWLFIKVLLKAFRFQCVRELWGNKNLIRMFRIPNEIRNVSKTL